MRCPLCDGPVVNGRCKDCGMPYRKDEILYHLNESRDEHYRHASDKARKIMMNQQKAASGTTAKGSSRTISKKTVQEQQKKIRQEAMQKMSAAGNTDRTAYGNRNTSRSMSGERKGKKKTSKIGLLIAILTILAVVAPMTDDLFDMIDDLKYKNSYESSYTEPADTDEDTEDTNTYFYGWKDDDGYNYYSLAAGFGTAVAGDQIEAGKYGIYTTSDKVTLTVTNDKSENEEYTIEAGDDTLFLTLKDGDTITVDSEESDYDSVYLMEWED